jgi:hypothetical protein
MSTRPRLDKTISLTEFIDFYWLKSELQTFCRDNSLSTVGSKIDLTRRIEEFLKTGVVKEMHVPTSKVPRSEQSKAPITNNTVIGTEYRSYQEKKLFFQSVVGKKFHFTTHLLNYLRENAGKKTYKDAVDEWSKGQDLKKNPNHKSVVAPQFEYNQYIRDFMNDNKRKSLCDAIKCWKAKKSKPGSRKYSRNDLNIL